MKVNFRVVLLNILILLIFLALVDLTSWITLTLKYPKVEKKYSDSFFYKLKPKTDTYLDKKSDFFLFHPKFGVKFKPNTKFFGLSPDENGDPKYELKNGLNVDSFGYVSTGNKIKRTKGKRFKILLSGGSTTAGWGATNNLMVWGSKLELKIQNYFDSMGIEKVVEVRNSAVLGYALSHELDLYINETQFLNPDIVISFNGINERWSYKGDPVSYGMSSHHNRIMAQIYGLKSLRVFGILPNLKILLNLISNSSNKVKFGYQQKDFLQKTSGEVFEKKLLNFKKLVKANGSEFLWVLQPLLGVCPRNMTEREQSYKNFFGSEFYAKSWDTYINEARSFYNPLRNKVTENWQIDWTCLFNGVNETVYYDPRHYNDLGQELIAKRLFLLLKEKGWLK